MLKVTALHMCTCAQCATKSETLTMFVNIRTQRQTFFIDSLKAFSSMKLDLIQMLPQIVENRFFQFSFEQVVFYEFEYFHLFYVFLSWYETYHIKSISHDMSVPKLLWLMAYHVFSWPLVFQSVNSSLIEGESITSMNVNQCPRHIKVWVLWTLDYFSIWVLFSLRTLYLREW